MDGRYIEQVNLKELTTMRAGGPARIFVSVHTTEELASVIGDLQQKKIPWVILGGGSNIVFADSGFDGCVIKMDIRGMETRCENDQKIEIEVGAGIAWDDFVKETCERGLWGIENLSGIPGSVGATPVQNVGAYGVEVRDVITEVRVFDAETQTQKIFTNAECLFGYRDSIFKKTKGRYVITHVVFSLSKIPASRLHYKDLAEYFKTGSSTLSEIRAAILRIRADKFPDTSVVGTCGSFFKNPILPDAVYEDLLHIYPDIPTYPAGAGYKKIALGWVLDAVCRLKGYRSGAVQLFERQALVLVAHDGATATEIDSFACEIEKKVFEMTKIKIEREVVCL